ncbi:MAG: DUF4860 domain-containing protein [Oscillospiraceae bacterium]|nr:DUF4860 domain-containing protein [Oscillospiraceae bacterium]
MRRQTGAGAIASLILACVFGATLLLSLAAGAAVYRNVAARTEQGASTRVGLTYLTAKIHGGDRADAVHAGTFCGVDAVYLLQDMDGLTYETILYVYDGRLRELLCEQGWELEPADGEIITEAQSLTVTELADGLLRLVYTDGGGTTETADIFVRSS